ncbi:MAG: YgfZ/GcvT domain-containing protein [Ilumatobacteraceae bacterium]
MPESSQQVVVGRVRRAAFLVTGRDAGTYLHSQVSNDIMSQRIGESCQCFVLEPTGKIDALIRITKIGDEPTRFLVDVDDIEPALVAARLERFKIRVQADITPVNVEVLAVRAVDRLEDGVVMSTPISESARNSVADVAQRMTAAVVSSGAEAWTVPAWWGDGRALDVIITGSGLSTVPDTLVSGDPTGPHLVTDDVIEALRVRCGWPAMGSEIRPGETIPAATGVVSRTVSFTKGCYPGQELVERMDSRGSSAPQSLRIVAGSLLGEVRPGSAIEVDGNDVGTVTSVAGGLVLAYVSRSVSLGVVVGDS